MESNVTICCSTRQIATLTASPVRALDDLIGSFAVPPKAAIKLERPNLASLGVTVWSWAKTRASHWG